MKSSNTSAQSLDLGTVFSAIDIPVLILDDAGEILVWNEPLGDVLGVSRSEAEDAETIGQLVYDDRELLLAEKVYRHPQNADEIYDVGIADDEYALLSVDGQPTYEDTSTATLGSGEELWFLAVPLYLNGEFAGVIEVVQRQIDSERRYREMDHLIEELRETLTAFQKGDLTARAEYDFAESLMQDEDVDLLEQVNDIARMREALKVQIEETERTKRQLERRNEELEQKNERLDEFASVVSHDLRNPLNIATTNLEQLRAEHDSEYAEAVVRAHERMDGLIEDLLTLARDGKAVGDTESINLSWLTESSWQNVATSDAKLTVEIESTIQADRSRVQQLLENLFKNAIEHGGEEVTVRVGELPDGFFVEDNGPGIPKDEQEKVVEAGYTTSDTGTGFGLNIVSDVVDAHGWKMNVTEGSRGGARVEITGIESVET